MKYPDGMDQMVDIIRASKTFEDAYSQIRKITGVPSDTAKWFRTTYGVKGNSDIGYYGMEDAFRNFYDEVLTDEGQLRERLIKLIRGR